MSARRGGVAIPLVTLIVSFLVVLLVGGWLGTSTSSGAGSPGPTQSKVDSQPTSSAQVVRIVVDGLTGRQQELEPFEGLRMTVSPDASNPATGGPVNVCLSLTPKWKVAGSAWKVQNKPDGSTAYCRLLSVNAGRLPGVDIQMEKQ